MRFPVLLTLVLLTSDPSSSADGTPPPAVRAESNDGAKSGDSPKPTDSRNPGGPPNVVFILADDLGYGDLGCYGQTDIRTPNIDTLADRGMRFTQAYAGAPVCTASRAVLMTGRHNGHSPARDNIPHYPTYLDDGDVTIAEVLRDAGYRTGGFGKWSLGDPGSVGRATAQGFDTWFGYLNQDHAHHYWPEYLDDDEGRYELDGNTRSRDRYSHDLIAARALGFIDAAAKDGRPFFLYAAFALPHYASTDESSDGLSVPDVRPYEDRDWSTRARKYAAMVTRLDDTVGQIVDAVERLNDERPTLIVFTSDNGGHTDVDPRFDTGGPLRGFKRDLYEGGIRVPMIAACAGMIPASTVSDDVVAFHDVLPTLAALADVTPPDDVDGRSMVSILRGEADPADAAARDGRTLYWDYGHCRDRYDRAVRWGDWKAIRRGVDGDIELYDLSRDLDESDDLAAEHPDLVAEADRRMEAAFVPHPRYPIGQRYRGSPIW